MASEITFRGRGMHPTEFKVGDEHLVGRNKEINAYDKKDLISQQGRFVSALASGEVKPGTELTAAEKSAKVAYRRSEMLAAYEDQGGRKFAELGAAMALEISENANRDGFMRRFLMRYDLEQGQRPMIRVNFKSQIAIVASSAAAIQPVMVRGKYIYPPEFYIEDYLLIEQRDLVMSTTDIMEEKLLEGQEAIMVGEDRTFKKLVDGIVGKNNQLINIVGAFTPQALSALRQQVINWGLPALNLLFASDVWGDFLTATGFISFYDPVSQYEIVQTGMLGRILGMSLISDAVRAPTLRVLKQGEIYVFSSPEYLGAYTDRGPVVAREIDGMAVGIATPSRGWAMNELMSIAVVNGRAVAKAIRS